MVFCSTVHCVFAKACVHDFTVHEKLSLIMFKHDRSIKQIKGHSPC